MFPGLGAPGPYRLPSRPAAAVSTPDKPPRPRPFNLVRSFSLADFVTLGNAAAGAIAIFCCLNHLERSHDPVFLGVAFAMFPLAFVFDALDGKVARWRQQSSPYGADLDSLADVVSFGVAPAMLGFTLGLRGFWDAVVLTYFVCCGVMRLARFNVTRDELEDETGKVKYFEGTPIPTSNFIVLFFFILWLTVGFDESQPWMKRYLIWPGQFHPLVLLYAVSGSLMVSDRLRIPKF